MSANLNSVTLAGNIGKLDLFTTPSGMAIVTIQMAVTKYKKKDDGFEESSNWFTLKLFGQGAERVIANNAVGDNILIMGELETNAYEQDGVKRYQTYVVVNKLQTCKLGKNNPRNNQSSDTAQPQAQPAQFNMKYAGNENTRAGNSNDAW